MNFNTITTLIVSVIVVVMISSAAIIPIVQEAQNDITSTNDNVGYRFLATSTSVEEITYTASGADNKYTVNGTEFASPNSRIVSAGESFFAVFTQNSFTLSGGSSKISGVSTFSWSSGSISYTLSDSSTGSISDVGDIYYAATNGDMTIYYGVGAGPVNIDKDKSYLLVANAATTYQTAIVKNGNLESVPMAYYSGADYTNTLTVTSEEFEHYNQITTIELGVSYGDPATTVNYQFNTGVTLSIIAPLEYTVVDKDNVTYALLGVIGLLCLVIPIMLVIRAISNGRD